MCNGKTTLSFVLFMAIACAFALPAVQPTAAAAPAPLPAAVSPLARDEWGGEPLRPGRGCTTVYATDGKQMLGGNNEDFRDPLTKVSFVPGEEGAFGRVYFGYENWWTEGGMNDQGLFFDGLAVGIPVPVDLEGKDLFSGTNFLDFLMARCATVACVVEMFEQYYTEETWAWQHLFGDATGESAIIEPRTIIRQRGGYQVATNFYQSTTPPQERDCWRYQTATEMLEAAAALSVEYIRDVMAAVHQGGPGSRTLYTNVYDLANRLVYLYHFYDYEHVVVIDLEEELAKGAHVYDLPALFPPNLRAEQFSAPILRGYDDLIQSRLAEVDAAVLAACVGEYEMAEGSGWPDDRITVVPHGDSLMLVFPSYHRAELFPQGGTSFFAVTWAGREYEVRFDANFGVDAGGRVQYLELVYPEGAVTRHRRLDREPAVQEAATPLPVATVRPTATARPVAEATATSGPTTTPRPTATAEPTAAPTVTPVEATPAPGFPWGWAIVPVALLAAAAGWVAMRRRRSAGG
jgi:hypothetical protein